MSIEDLIEERLRKVLEERLRPIEERLARLSMSAPATSEEDELSLAEAETASGYKVDTLRRAISAKELAAAKGKKEWRVRRGDLKAWMHRKPGGTTIRPLDLKSKVDHIIASVGGSRQGG